MACLFGEKGKFFWAPSVECSSGLGSLGKGFEDSVSRERFNFKGGSFQEVLGKLVEEDVDSPFSRTKCPVKDLRELEPMHRADVFANVHYQDVEVLRLPVGCIGDVVHQRP